MATTEEATRAPTLVALGGGDGALEACELFFRRAAVDEGMAYVVMLNLQAAPPIEQIAARLQTATRMCVTPAVDGEVQLAPNTVYVVSPHRELCFTEGVMRVDGPVGFEAQRAPIDIYFRQVAEAHGSRAACVLLSGVGASGSMGLKRVKERGGLVLAEAPLEAAVPEMPHHAIATGLVDWVLPAADMPARIAAYWRRLAAASLEDDGEAASASDEVALREIFAVLRRHTGHDFSNYKRATIIRRLQRRMSVHNTARLEDYAHVVAQQRLESAALLKDLLISVTNFFRDPEAFQVLAERVVPMLFRSVAGDEPLRAWVAGCATGEEAYSVAMLLAEHAATVPTPSAVQVFATDLDAEAIAHARRGLYTTADVADVSPERLRRFFVKDGHGYRVSRDLRETVLFAEHNLLKDPPFVRMQLVTCRNVLIYFNRRAQEQALGVLHFALNGGGYLFLGSSEAVNGATDLFSAFSKEQHIYQSRPVMHRLRLRLPEPTAGLLPTPSAAGDRSRPANDHPAPATALELHQRLLDLHSPPSLVVSAEYEIVHLSDRAGRYLHFGGGEPSANLLDVVRPELRGPVRAALYRAAQTGASVTSDPVAVSVDGQTDHLMITVRPELHTPLAPSQSFLVIFEIATGVPDAPTVVTEPPESQSMQALADENQELRTRLQEAVSQHTAQAAEFRAANEELLAANEELRSTTEELQTSKEELNAVNEELHTVNQELKIRIEELSTANNDFRNLIAATNIGTVFLDPSLRVKLFTPAAQEIFHLIPEDIGRPLGDITTTLTHEHWLSDAASVVASSVPVERDVTTRNGNLYLLRISPYRAGSDHVDGVVMTFVDVTALKRSGEALRVSEERFRHLSESGLISIAFFGPSGQIMDANEEFLRLFGYTGDDVRAGQVRWDVLTPREWVPRARQAAEEFEQTGRILPHQREYVRRDGTRLWGLLAAARLEGTVDGVAVVIDLTQRHRPEPSR